MNTLKKAFRGYRTADVDELVHSLESQLESASSRCTALEKQLSEMSAAADEAKEKALKAEEKWNASEENLKRMRWECERMRAELSKKQNAAETVGGIYIKAFENGREIVASSKTKTEQFLDNVEGASKTAQMHFSEVQKEFADTTVQISAMIAEINRHTELLNQRITELAAHTEAIGSAYSDFDAIRKETKENIAEIQRNYDHIINNFLNVSPASPVLSKAPQQVHAVEEEKPTKQLPQETKTVIIPTPQRQTEETDQMIKEEVSAKQQELKTESQVQRSPEPVADQTDFTDTAADFRDDMDFDTENAFEEGAKESGSKLEEVVRGQNILSLLSKYQKQ